MANVTFVDRADRHNNFQLALQDSIGGRPITAFQRCAASRGPLFRSTLTVPRYDVLSRSCCSAIADS